MISDEALKICIGQPRLLMEFLVDLSLSLKTVSDANLLKIFESAVSEFEAAYIQSWKLA